MKLNVFDICRMRDWYPLKSVLILGPTDAPRTMLACDIINELNAARNIVCVSPDRVKNYDGRLSSETYYLRNHHDVTHLDRIIDIQSQVVTEKQTRLMVVVEHTHQPSFYDHPAFRRILFNGRFYQMDLVLLDSPGEHLTHGLCSQFDFVFMFAGASLQPGPGRRYRQALWDSVGEMCGPGYTFLQFEALLVKYTSPGKCLVLPNWATGPTFLSCNIPKLVQAVKSVQNRWRKMEVERRLQRRRVHVELTHLPNIGINFFKCRKRFEEKRYF